MPLESNFDGGRGRYAIRCATSEHALVEVPNFEMSSQSRLAAGRGTTQAEGRERPPRPRLERGMEASHDHVDCPPDQRLWLEGKFDQAATIRLHSFCMSCGKVKNLDGPPARALGFYLSGLSALKEHLERSAKHHKMTQSQSRLIGEGLRRTKEFEDPYGMRLEAQARLYLEAVKKVRPDLDETLVLRLLPKLKRKSRRPLLEMMAEASGT